MIIQDVFRIGRVQYGAGTGLGPRDTIEFEFVRILKGHVCWIYDDVPHSAPPGTWILSQPTHRERYEWDRYGVTQHDHIHFTLIETPESFPSPEFWPIINILSAHNVMQALFQQIISLDQHHHPQSIELIKLTVQQMLYYWVLDAHQFEDLGLKPFEAPLQKVIDSTISDWKKGNIKPMSLEDMVAISHLSRSSFIRAFENVFDLSPSKFFECQRLYLGRLYLLESNRSIEDISKELKYSSLFHFSKNFKQLFHCSPNHYKKSTQRENPLQQNFLFQRVFNSLSATQTM